MEIKVLKNIMQHNEDLAAENKTILDRQGIYCINMMSSPGAGKTSILEQTIARLKRKINIAIIEGDLMTSRDAERIDRTGVPVVQINTEGGCHLDTNMVNKALQELVLEGLDLLIIENVGNLVCPGTYYLGEHDKVVVLSVPEGHDKPAKYPLMFQEAHVCLLNKVDLLKYSNFDEKIFLSDVQALNEDIEIIRTSVTTGQGLEDWCQLLLKRIAGSKKTDVGSKLGD